MAALVGGAVSLFTAAGAFVTARAPDFRDVRPLGWVAITAALNAALCFTTTIELSPAIHVWALRLELVVIAVHLVAWHTYVSAWARRPLAGRERAALGALFATSLVALVPGAVCGDAVRHRAVEWLGVVYHEPLASEASALVYGALLAAGVWGVVRTARLGRAGARWPRTHLACTVALLALGVHDAAVAAGLPIASPYLFEFGFIVPMFVLGLLVLERVTEGTVALHRREATLAEEIRQRAEALARSEEALARAERLALLGQISASVAHEVNNPTAVVSANLAYLGFALRDDPRPQLRSCLEDSEAAVARIAGIVKQLLVAGRSARSPDAPVAPVSLSRAVDAALAAARARGAAHVTFERDVPAALNVLAHPDPLVQVLTNLIVNAVQAVPAKRGGRVAVRALPEGERVRVVVEDDGEGMSAETLQRIFEPFYSTKPAGAGTGLGLAVSRALAEAMRGTLRFESTRGAGTRAILELAASDAAPALTPAPTARLPAVRKGRLLLVDDDEQVRCSLARLLGLRFDVTVADGVSAGLDEVFSHSFDVVLCDVVMPAGGGQRFFEEVTRCSPRAAERIVFMTGGAPTPAAREFVAGQPQPVLEKPIDLAAVEGALARLGRDRAAAGLAKAC